MNYAFCINNGDGWIENDKKEVVSLLEVSRDDVSGEYTIIVHESKMVWEQSGAVVTPVYVASDDPREGSTVDQIAILASLQDACFKCGPVPAEKGGLFSELVVCYLSKQFENCLSTLAGLQNSAADAKIQRIQCEYLESLLDSAFVRKKVTVEPKFMEVSGSQKIYVPTTFPHLREFVEAA